MTWTVDVLSRVDFIGIPSLLITTTPSTLCMIVNMMSMMMMMMIMKVMLSCLHLRICANSFQDLFNLIHDINIKCDLIVILIVILLYSCGILMMAINKMKLLRIRHAHVWLGLMMLIIQFCLRSERNWPTRLLLSLPHPEFWLMMMMVWCQWWMWSGFLERKKIRKWSKWSVELCEFQSLSPCYLSKRPFSLWSSEPCILTVHPPNSYLGKKNPQKRLVQCSIVQCPPTQALLWSSHLLSMPT